MWWFGIGDGRGLRPPNILGFGEVGVMGLRELVFGGRVEGWGELEGWIWVEGGAWKEFKMLGTIEFDRIGLDID